MCSRARLVASLKKIQFFCVVSGLTRFIGYHFSFFSCTEAVSERHIYPDERSKRSLCMCIALTELRHIIQNTENSQKVER